MLVHPVVQTNGGVISVTIQVQFVGQPSQQQDAMDTQKIGAFGDPLVNIAGVFTDPANNQFTFQFPQTEQYVGITTQLASQTARFYVALPATSAPGQQPPVQGALDCITPNPTEASTAWYNVICSRIQQAMLNLRMQTLPPVLNNVVV